MKTYDYSRFIAGIALLLLMVASRNTRGEESKTYAIIVANNHSLDTEDESLRFADDDGVKYLELFEAIGADAELFAILDSDAQDRYPAAHRRAKLPKKTNILHSIRRLFRQIESEKDLGRETHFFFVFTGHGNVGPNNEGYIHFLDAKFRRSEIYREIIAPSPATYNHIVLDACHSYFLINKKGGNARKMGDHRAAVRDFLRKEDLNSYPNTGVILAMSSESETHEWSRWEAGLFSHELRGALLGAADINRDQIVTYAEAAACVEAANSAVKIPKARLKVYYRPPSSNAEAPLINLNVLEAPLRISFPKSMAGHYHVEDSRAVRVLDFNFTEEQPLQVALLGRGPFYVRTRKTETAVEASATVIEGNELIFTSRQSGSKGSVDRSFRQHLYEIPFGLGFFRGIVSADFREDPVEVPSITLANSTRIAPISKWDNRPLLLPGWLALGSGLVAGGAGGIVYYLSTLSYEDYQNATTNKNAENKRETTDNRLLTSRILLGSAVGLAFVGSTLLIVDAIRNKPNRNRPGNRASIRVFPQNEGLAVTVGGKF